MSDTSIHPAIAILTEVRILTTGFNTTPDLQIPKVSKQQASRFPTMWYNFQNGKLAKKKVLLYPPTG